MKSKLLVFTVLGVFLVMGLLLTPLVASKLKKPPVTSPRPVNAQAITEQPARPAPIETVSVDFENTQLAEVVQFITAKTHVKFVFDGLGTNPITWQEFDVPVFDLVKSFERVLKSSGVNFTYSDGCILLTKRMPQSELERLDFAISEKGTFFLYRGKVYEASTLLCSLRRINGQWFAVAAGSGTGNQGDQLPAIAGFGRLELTAQK